MVKMKMSSNHHQQQISAYKDSYETNEKDM